MRDAIVRNEVRLNRPHVVDREAILQGCRESTSDMPESTKEAYLINFVRAAKTVSGSQPPQEYYPHIVDTLMKDLKQNLEVLPECTPSEIIGNTIRFGGIAPQLSKDFPDLDYGHTLRFAMQSTIHPRRYLEGLQHNFERLCREFPDEDLYPRQGLVNKAMKANTGLGVEAAKLLPDVLLFSKVRARRIPDAAPDLTTTHTEALEAGRAALIEAHRRKKPRQPAQEENVTPNAILQTLFTSNLETVDAIRRKVDGALGDERRRVVSNWQDRQAQKGAKNTDKQK